MQASDGLPIYPDLAGKVAAAGDWTDLAAVEQMRQQVEQSLGPAEVWPRSWAADGHDLEESQLGKD